MRASRRGFLQSIVGIGALISGAKVVGHTEEPPEVVTPEPPITRTHSTASYLPIRNASFYASSAGGMVPLLRPMEPGWANSRSPIIDQANLPGVRGNRER